jgi:hypothetical protein
VWEKRIDYSTFVSFNVNVARISHKNDDVVAAVRFAKQIVPFSQQCNRWRNP